MEKVLDKGLVFAKPFQEIALLHTVMHFHLVILHLFPNNQVYDLNLFIDIIFWKLFRVKLVIYYSLFKKLFEIFAEMEVGHVL